MRKIVVILIIIGLHWGCKDPELSELSFFTVTLKKPEIPDVGSVQLEAQIKGLNKENIETCGFVWSLSKDSVDQYPAALRRILPQELPIGNDQFSALFGIQPNQAVYFRAFGQLGARMVYSTSTEQAALGEIVDMDRSAEVLNNDVRVYGRLIGIEQLEQTLACYGHVFSASNADPTVNGADCDTTKLLNASQDIAFSSLLKGLKFNTNYFVRAYAFDGGGYFYSQRVDTFRVRDGWVRLSQDFPSEFNEGLAVMTESGFAFAGSGINSFDGPANDILKDFWKFNPGSETWGGVKPFSNNPSDKVTNASAFSIGDTIYMLFGHHNIPTTLMVRNFWKYAISSDQWIDASFDIPYSQTIFSGRSGAAGFVLDGKIYVGSGQFIVNGMRRYLNDFWQYDPGTSNWRQVKHLPMKTTQGVQQLGRYEAVGFASETKGYVGGGEFFGLTTTDFWRFTPPLTQNPQDSGVWEVLPKDFPGLGRAGAISFTIGNKAYYGCGYNLAALGLSDFYAFDFGTEQWSQKTPFQGGRRYDMVGFGTNTYGYCGTGVERRVSSSGQSIEQVIHKDFWRYIPESN